ncbi:YybH family protein [Marinicella rhabdoformis]|uniref:YybH family protein n=1 Tax=Marinicella rhabdoformis TaxID=2580566 RepID=UPI001C551DFB|nr:nuclear transport factor 2 family protein [Marinicella rhabdoformis]
MKSKIFTSVLSVYLTFFSLSALSHSNKNDEPINPLFTGLGTKAAKVVTQFHEALKAGDVKLVNSLLSKDVLIYESGNAERSSLEYVSGHLLSDIKYLSSVQSELIEHQVKVNGNIAISTSRSKVSKAGAGKASERISMETIAVSKIDGKWLITHIHWS